MILGQTRSARLGCRFAQACGCFQPVGRVKNRAGRLASSTGKSRARQGAGPAGGARFRHDSMPIVRGPTNTPYALAISEWKLRRLARSS